MAALVVVMEGVELGGLDLSRVRAFRTESVVVPSEYCLDDTFLQGPYLAVTGAPVEGMSAVKTRGRLQYEVAHYKHECSLLE